MCFHAPIGVMHKCPSTFTHLVWTHQTPHKFDSWLQFCECTDLFGIYYLQVRVISLHILQLLCQKTNP